MINYEGGAIPEEYQVEYVADRVDTTSNVCMGLTMGCARCHDHKYDPISQKEYLPVLRLLQHRRREGLDGKNGNAAPFLKMPDRRAGRRREGTRSRPSSRSRRRSPAKTVNDADGRVARLARRQARAVNRDGLIAHYDIRRQPRRHLRQLSRRPHRQGRPGFRRGQVGQVVAFDGQTLVTLGIAGAFERAEPFAVAFWLRSGAQAAECRCFEKIDRPESPRLSRSGSTSRSGRIQNRAAQIAVSAVRPNGRRHRCAYARATAFTQDEWHHVALNFDGNGKAAGVTSTRRQTRARSRSSATRSPVRSATDAELPIGVKEPDAKPLQRRHSTICASTLARCSPKEIETSACTIPSAHPLRQSAASAPRTEEERLRDYYPRAMSPTRSHRAASTPS